RMTLRGTHLGEFMGVAPTGEAGFVDRDRHLPSGGEPDRGVLGRAEPSRSRDADGSDLGPPRAVGTWGCGSTLGLNPRALTETRAALDRPTRRIEESIHARGPRQWRQALLRGAWAGRPILCIHGTSSSAMVWRPAAIEELAMLGRVICYHRRGCTRSERADP